MVVTRRKKEWEARVKRVGEKLDLRTVPSKAKRLADLQKKLNEAQAQLAEKERENDTRGVNKMNEIIANLKQTIQGM